MAKISDIVDSVIVKVNEHTTDINSLETITATHTTDITTVNNNVTSLTTDLGTERGRVDQNVINIANLSATTNTLTTGISNIENDITAIEGSIDNINSNISSINTELDGHDNDISTLTTNKLDKNGGTITGALTVTATLTADNFNVARVMDSNYVDPDSVGANATAVLYADGTVIGSNDNGSYVKYPNGEVSIRKSGISVTTSISAGGIYFSPPLSITYPISVTEIEVSTTVEDNNTTYVWGGSVRSKTLNGCSLVIMSGSSGSNGKVGYIAQGRWQ